MEAIIPDIPSNYAFCKRNDKWVLSLKKPCVIEVRNRNSEIHSYRLDAIHKRPWEQFICVRCFELIFKNKKGKIKQKRVPNELIVVLKNELFSSIKDCFVLDDEGLAREELPMEKLLFMTKNK